MKKLLKCSIKYTVGFSKRVGRESVSERGFESERRKHYYLHKNMYL